MHHNLLFDLDQTLLDFHAKIERIHREVEEGSGELS